MREDGPEPNQELHRMRVDVAGRLRNTSVGLQHAFLPLFEAVVNSIHTTTERFGDNVATKGKVEVRLHRVRQQQLSGISGKSVTEDVLGFSIRDNGIGFTDSNMLAFETADSTAKLSQGGKGVGRFTWLVVFDKAEISSYYYDSTDEIRHRSFAFLPTESGVANYRDEPAPGQSESRTAIELRGVKEKYVAQLRKPGAVIAEQLFEHCFNTFVLRRCPEIKLIDELVDNEETIIVNNHIGELTLAEPEALLVGPHLLKIRNVQQPYKSGRKHQAHLCGNDRVVTSLLLSQISDLGTEPLREPDKDLFVHHVYVSGPALDAAVDSTRTRLELPDGQPINEAAGELDLKALREAIGKHVNKRLGSVLAAQREENFRRVENHVRTQQPEYRHLLVHRREQLARLKWSDNPQQLDESLYRVQQDLDAEVRQRLAEVEKKLIDEKTELGQIAEELYRAVSESNAGGQADLVRYVTKRRAVLQLLGRMISRFQGVALEEHIHRIVFPLKKTGDQVPLDEHNLWLVDDSLAFYEYLTSDMPFSKNAASPTDSLRRPDILAFKTGDPYQHIAIVEFKRPDEEHSDPVRQLIEYAQLLRKGGSIDINGRTLPGVSKTVRIDAYAILTLTPRVEESLEISSGDLRKVENEWRWYGHVTNLNVTIEVLDYRAFIRRAEQRNRTFFAKLGLQ